MKVSEILSYLDVYSPWKALVWRDRLRDIAAGKLVAPVFMEIHPEAWCPHDCSFCAYRNSGWNDMKFFGEWAKDAPSIQTGKPKGKRVDSVSGWSLELAQKLPKEMRDEGILAAEITGSGEPLAYPHIQELLDSLAENEIEIGLVTNGQLLADKKIQNLRWARFSIDAASEEIYSKVHGVSRSVFSRVRENFGRMVEEFPEAYLGVSFIVTADNYTECLDATRLWKSLGAKNIRFSFEYEPTGSGKLISAEKDEARKQIAEAKKLQGKEFRVFGQVDRLDVYSRPNTDFSFCGYQMLVWNVGYDAKVYPCCIEIYRPNMVIGDLTSESLHGVIYGEKRQKFIDAFDVRKCHPCWLRDKNIAIETILAPEKRIGHERFV